jgi:streptogramin lyase
MVDLGDYQCNDTGGAAACTGPQSVFLRAMSPESYEVTATASFEGLMDAAVAVGADAVWVAGVPRNPSSGGLFRMDPGTGDVSSRLPVDSPSAVDLGEDSVWVTSEARGALIRVDPGSGEKMADVNVSSGGASGVAAGESAVWVASWGPVSGPGGEDRYGGKKLIRVNPDTDEVTAEIPIEQNAPEGGASSVAVDEETGAVWATSVNGKLVRVDPGTNRIVAELDLGDYAWEVETFAGDAWVIYETGVNDPSTPATQRIARIDSGTKRPVGSIAVDGARDLAVGRDALWLTSSDIESGAGSLTRIEP